VRPRPTEVATVAAPAHQVQAHQLLHSWAPGPAEHATACGIAITHRIGFQALVELSRCRQRSGRQPARPGQRPARSCCQASDGRPRARPTHSECCCGCRSRAAGDRRHAPITPGWRILSHHYSPLLAAIQLHSVRDQLPPDQQLTGLQQHPPPIDYPSRRAAGDNLALLAAAVNAGRHRHPNRLRRGVLAASTRL